MMNAQWPELGDDVKTADAVMMTNAAGASVHAVARGDQRDHGRRQAMAARTGPTAPMAAVASRVAGVRSGTGSMLDASASRPTTRNSSHRDGPDR
jgi:selenocysteine lyase/cysteine desulfurase